MSSISGLVNYGDSDDEHEDPRLSARAAPAGSAGMAPAAPGYGHEAVLASIHPSPISHCPWSACYDEGSGFTYYWNQQTNAVTWETPPEYLLALKVAQQHMQQAGSAEVSAEEWQLYQQALAEKQTSQNRGLKGPVPKPIKKVDTKEKPKPIDNKGKKLDGRKRRLSEDEDEKIELITSYHNSDSDSNDESESPAKSSITPKPAKPPAKLAKLTKPPTVPAPKPPKKAKKQTVEYGPSLPPNQNYTVPIGPELPPQLMDVNKPPETVTETAKDEGKNTPKSNDNDESEDESLLLIKLKDKAKLLEKLGGEIPSELQKIIQDECKSGTASPIKIETKKVEDKVGDIDDLLAEIEKKELPKIKSKDGLKSNETSAKNSPRNTPPREEAKPLFPSSKAIVEEAEKPVTSLFPSAVNIQENGIEKPVEAVPPKSDTPPPPPPEKKANMYLPDASEVPTASRKRLRISNSVLPDRTKAEAPAYTTKYSTHIEGFSSERTGLGFSNDDEADTSKKPTISYGNGLMFTKGEILNEDKKDEELEDMADLVQAKLNYLNQIQPCMVPPVQEMLIQMQTLNAAWTAGALNMSWWRRWVSTASEALARQEASAAPPGWACSFQRSAARYQYCRLADGLTQWEYPAPVADMDISTTPPHPGIQEDTPPPPPLPVAPPPPPPPAPAPAPRVRTPPPPSWAPPPPAWADPPPPGTDDTPPPLPSETPKQEIGDELASFYSDIAELEKQTPASTSTSNSPEHGRPALIPAPIPAPVIAPAPVVIIAAAPAPAAHTPEPWDHDKRDKEARDSGKSRKKSKVKISSSIGMKHKSVSNLVAKWQQVAEEINSD